MKPLQDNTFHIIGITVAVAGCLVPSVQTGALAQGLPDQGYTRPEDIPPGYVLVDGDMLLPSPTVKPQATYETNLWPNGIVPYEFDANVVGGLRGVANPQAAMLQAMADWEAVANVDFRPRNGEADYVHIQNSTGNNSQIGRQGGRQIINIFNWDFEFIMAHELGHALGYYHEQSRADRAAYVTINTANISQTACGGGPCDSQFQLESGSDNYGPYDFDSVMHYGQCAFSVCGTCPGINPANCITITVQPAFAAQWQTAIGQRTHLSYWDSQVMSFMYPPPNWRFQRPGGNDGSPGSFLQPYATFTKGVQGTPAGGHLWLLAPQTISGVTFLNKPMQISAPVGGVKLVP
jgi:hypothetical protein